MKLCHVNALKFVMAGARPSGMKRPRVSLSLCKNKKKKGTTKDVEGEGTPSVPSASSSILSFFNSVPPAKIACPLCGQMVPRYRINEHMDETCQRNIGEKSVEPMTLNCFRNESAPAANVGSNYSSCFPKNPLNLDTSPSKSTSLKTGESAAQQVSPYFSNSSSVCSGNSEPQAQRIEVVSLGSLSSKLSRRRHIQGRKQIMYKEIDSSPPAVYNADKSAAAWVDDEIYAGHSSQKENQPAQEEQQEQNFSKKEPEFEEEISNCNGRNLGTVQVSLPAENIHGKRLPVSTMNTKKTRSEDVARNLDTFRTHVAVDTSSELINSLEVKTQPHSGVISSKTEVDCSTQNCFSKDDVLPVEVHEDFKDSLSETVEKIEFQSSIGDILDKINEVSSVPSSPGHPYYLQNFLVVLRAVLENEDDARLFDEQDLNVIAKFCELSGIFFFFPK